MRTPGGRALQIAFLPIIILVFYLNAVAHYGYTPDDTFIYLQFARNFLAGAGISFNAGEPTYGITSPLWFLMIAGGGTTGLDLLTIAKVLDLACACFALIVFYLVAFEVIRDVAVAICATVAFSVNTWFLRWAGTGMETSLSVFIVLLVLLACLRNSYVLAGLLAAIATLVRPEAFLLLPVILLDAFINSHDRRRALVLNAAVAGVYTIVSMPWLIFAFRTFGTIIPNTARAKAGLTIDPRGMWATAMDVTKTVAASDGAGVFVLLVAGSLLLLSRKKTVSPGGTLEDEGFFLVRQSLVGVGWLIILPLFYICTGTNVVSRYLVPVTPVITIFGLLYVHRVFLAGGAIRLAHTAVIVVTGLMMLQNQLFYQQRVRPGIDTFEVGMESCLIPIGVWFNEHTPPGAVIFAPDIGALGYYSGRRVCDASGLVTPSVLDLVRRGVSGREMIRGHVYTGLCNADYVVYRSFTEGDLKDEAGLSLMLTRPFAGIDLAETRVMYYSVYRVLHLSSLSGGGESHQ